MRLMILLLSALSLAARPQLPATEFAAHRAKVLLQMEKNSLAVMTGAKPLMRNNDIEYPFRQNSDFFYLSGYDRPDSRLILIKGDQPRFILFVEQAGPHSGIWNTAPYSPEEVKKYFAPDTVYSPDQFEEILKQELRGKSTVYYDFTDHDLGEKISEIVSAPWGRYPKTLHDFTPLVAEARLIKSPAEIAMLQKAVDITNAAHREVMRATRSGLFEYQVNALITFIYRSMNSPRDGFPSIVGSGPNSTILHYEKYDRQLEDGDMMVLDIGAEYGMYSADVTRTIPVSGTFSPEQKDIYEIVLAAQQAGIEKTAPGVGFGEVGRASTRVISAGLKRLGLITDENSRWQTRVWLMHGVSHWLGLDTHDAGSYLAREGHGGRLLEPGMVFTVEPGIYVSADALEKMDKIFGRYISAEELARFKDAVRPAVEKYKNIGVRIEDDILVTENGHKNLSAASPRAVREIENLMKKSSAYLK